MGVMLSPLRAGRPLPPGRFLALISVRGWVDPRAIMWLQGLGQSKYPMTSSVTEPATFRLVAEYLEQPRAPCFISVVCIPFRVVLFTDISSISYAMPRSCFWIGTMLIAYICMHHIVLNYNQARLTSFCVVFLFHVITSGWPLNRVT
jgi:hypothetical protein